MQDVLVGDRKVPSRLLLGPGPSNVHPRVLRAISEPTIGHLDPDFFRIMNETVLLLRYVMQTDNLMTIPMSGTGSAAMETAMLNALEPGDRAIVCVCGVFGSRMADMAGRFGAEVAVVSSPMGRPIAPEDVRRAFKKAAAPVKLVAVVHAETSTGVLQPLEEIAGIAHENGSLVLVDAVTSLGGVPVPVAPLHLDIVYSATQKALSCPPGLGPITLNDNAFRAVSGRKSHVGGWYLDLSLIWRYWGEERFYHHTAPVNMIFALHEALRLIQEEGLEARFKRHESNARSLAEGLEAMGLRLLVDVPYRLPTLTTVIVPPNVDEAVVRSRLLSEYNIEIGGGLGDLKGRVWRIGLMGYSSRRENIVLFLSALEDILGSLGVAVERGAALAGAAKRLM